jgi:type VI secretion system protein ImpK
MRPEFAAVVDPIFQGAIELLQRIDRTAEDSPDVEHAKLLDLFDRAESVFGSHPQWQLARYAIAVWIDEVLLTTPWSGASWWRNHILEMELFQSRICNERFFELAREASSLKCKDALEVFYNCVLLGFRGMYAIGQPERASERVYESPTNIEQWMERTARMIDSSAMHATTTSATFRPIQGAPPLAARYQTVWLTLAAICLLLMNVAIFQYIQSSK